MDEPQGQGQGEGQAGSPAAPAEARAQAKAGQGPTLRVGRTRWWETGQRPIEHEEAWFAEAGLLFALDRDTLNRDGVAIFRGELRYGDERCPAEIVYPPGYLAGQHPVVIAPELPVGRHKGPDGVLCLDHPVLGMTEAMVGAEATELAEKLWRLSVEDPDALRALEADAPEPRAGNYHFEPGSAFLFFDVEVRGHEDGYLRLGASQPVPLRGALAGLGSGRGNDLTDLPVTGQNRLFAGPTTLCGFWRRVAEPPPGPDADAIKPWVEAYHADLVAYALRFATVHGQIQRAAVPAVVAFVFPDEGPGRDQWHDAWLLLVIDPDGTNPRFARVFCVNAAERWTRQPQLAPLDARSVAFVGAGALGSQVAALLGRAGTGEFFAADPDIVTPANRVRHEADLGDVGYPKIRALQNRLLRINPYVRYRRPSVLRFGAVQGAGDYVAAQREEERVQDELANCDLIINASAHIATGVHVSAVADAAHRPVLHVMVSSGAWGGRILLQRRGRSGCLDCLALHQDRPGLTSPIVPEWPEDPDLPEVMDRGCAQATFTGPGFEITETAAAATRVAIQALLDGEGYPSADFDLVTLRFRGGDHARPEAEHTSLPRHPDCPTCTSA